MAATIRLALVILTTACAAAPTLTLPLSAFPELPDAVRSDLARRGCRIPKSFEKRPHQNLIHADLNGNGVEDWAAFCVTKTSALTLLVYPDAGAKPVALGRGTFTATSDPAQARSLRLVTRQYVVIHNREVPASHFRRGLQCLEDGMGMGSSLHCFTGGKWNKYRGAD